MNCTRKTFISVIALLMGTATWADVEINETTFPNEEFRSWVLSQSYGQDGVLTEEEIANVTRITVMAGRDIQSLKGIEYFTALAHLDCGSNHLTELDVSKNTALTTLYCGNNQLTALNLSYNDQLTMLDCGRNQLTSLDVSKNVALTNIATSYNPLTSLDVSKNTALTDLSCTFNQLTSLDVSNNTALINLFCQSNQLVSLDVSKNTTLRKLVCKDNMLASLNVSGCVALESLRCSGNRLAELDVTGCPELEEIICYSNQIKGEAMDALVAGLSTSRGLLGVINYKDEQNVMTKTQVAAAKAKGWYVRYNDSNNQWKNYEGSDDTTGISATLSDKGQMTKDSWYDLQGRKIGSGKSVPLKGVRGSGIYIEGGKKKVK